MAQAPDYTPITSFADDETNLASGRATVRTQKLDDEFANIESSINALNDNLQEIQRDDGKLRDLIVEPYALSEQVRALLASKGEVKGLWQQNTNYVIGDVVQNSIIAYVCTANHNSGTLFNSALWMAISGDGTSLINAQNAAASAALAATSASNAVSSANSAATSATTATNQATTATNAATNASNSASQAQINATLSTAQANNAASSANAAELSAQEAADYASATVPHQTVTTTGTGAGYLATTPAPMTQFIDGKLISVVFHADCAANATIQFNGLLPLLDLKIQRSDGTYVPVAAGDIKAGTTIVCMFMQNGTSLLVEPSVSRLNVVYLGANTVLTVESALDVDFVVTAATSHVLPVRTTFLEGTGFTVTAHAATTLTRQGGDVILLNGAFSNSISLVVGNSYQIINSSGSWLCLP